jgi:hypothetical protein
MKIFNKIIISSLALVALTFSACSSDDNYTPGDQTNTDSLNVYFNNSASVTLPSESNTFNVVITRNTTKGQLTVPITLSSSNGYDLKGNPIFSAPSEVVFKDGEATETIPVQATDSIKMFNSYYVTINVPQNYTVQYKTNPVGQPRAELNIVKEDYKDYATGTYYSDFFGDGSTPYSQAAVMQYSAIKNTYRFKNIIEGETFTFSLGSDNSISYDWSSVFTGSVDATYGNISMSPSDKPVDYKSYYDPTTKTYYFGFKYTVSAGSFGSSYDRFVVANN